MSATSQMVMCRDLGHRWDEEVPLVKKRVLFGQRRVLRCERCASRQLQLIDINGKVASRKYELSAQYQMFTGITRSDARAVRIGAMRIYDVPDVPNVRS